MLQKDFQIALVATALFSVLVSAGSILFQGLFADDEGSAGFADTLTLALAAHAKALRLVLSIVAGIRVVTGALY